MAVLKWAGASYKRDTLDQRIIKNVTERSGRFIDVQGGFAHGTAYENTAHAWPKLQTLQALVAADCDGLPDTGDLKNGLDSKNKADASAKKLHAFYTNIEVYINSLVTEK